MVKQKNSIIIKGNGNKVSNGSQVNNINVKDINKNNISISQNNNIRGMSKNNINISQSNNGNSIQMDGKVLTINGEEYKVPGRGKNVSIVNGKIFVNGFELVNGKWKRTLKALWYRIL
ncbi:MAG: hypothetical protein ACOCQR_00930 [bacterium]